MGSCDWPLVAGSHFAVAGLRELNIRSDLWARQLDGTEYCMDVVCLPCWHSFSEELGAMQCALVIIAGEHC